MPETPTVTVIARGALPLDEKVDSSAYEDFVYLVSHDVRKSVRALIERPQWIEQYLKEAGVKIDGSLAAKISLMNTQTGQA